MRGKKILSIALALLMLVSLLPAAYADWTVPEGYGEDEYNQLAAFLEIEDADGVKNGTKLNEEYDVEDPDTWGDGWVFMPIVEPYHVSFIDWSDTELVGTLDISNFPELTFLYLSSTAITSVDASDCPELGDVECAYGAFESLDFSGCESLSNLLCDDNRLTSLNVSGCSGLTGSIFCDNNLLTQLDISDCVQLKTLVCSDNLLTSLNVKNCAALSTLNAENNALTEIDLIDCASLKVLNLTGNALKRIDMSASAQLHLDTVTANGPGTVGVWDTLMNGSPFTRLYAYPNEGAKFIGWYDADGELLSTDLEWDISGIYESVGTAVTATFRPVLDDGVYLCGTLNEWAPTAADKFVPNPDSSGEYMLETTLAKGDEIKVIESVDDYWTWYPGGGSANYVVDEAHAGEVTIYFKTTYVNAWADFGGYFYIEAKTAPAACTVSFDPNGGSGDMDSVLCVPGQAFELPACGFTPPEGKLFKAWSVVVGEAEPLILAPGEEFTVTADTSVTALWMSPWAALQQQINAAEDGVETTITLTENLTATDEDTALVIPGGKKITLETNGHVLDRGLSGDYMKAEGYVFFVSGGATLNISGGTVTGGGNSGSGGGIYVDAGAVLNLSNVDVVRNFSTDHGAGIYLADGAQCSAANSTVNNNRTTVGDNGSGGGIYFAGGTLRMTDCSVSDNRSKNLGGGIYVGSGSVELTGCQINRNDAYANACGGGVFLSGGSLLLDGCEIIGNTSSKNSPHGIGVFVNVGSMFVVSGDTKITNNKSGSKQLNVFLHNGALITPVDLADSAVIGVARGRTNSSYVAEYAAGLVTDGLPGNGALANFTSDLSSYRIGLNTNGEVILGLPVTVSFAAGDDSASGTMDDVSVAKGSVYTLPECGFEVSGKAFAGWQVFGETKLPGETIVVTANTTTVTATWAVQLTDGYYLIGPDWNIASIDPENKFEENESNPGEFMLTTTLGVGDEIKVVRVENSSITAWYPDGEHTQYTVDEAHAGSKTIYFKTSYVNDWAEFGGYFYIEAKPAPVAYSVTVSDAIEHGTVKADKESALEGETVTLTVTPDEGCKLVSLTRVTGDEDHYTEITDMDENGNYFFTMPAGSVTVNAVFGPKYTLSFLPGEVDGTPVAGETVVITSADENVWAEEEVEIELGKFFVMDGEDWFCYPKCFFDAPEGYDFLGWQSEATGKIWTDSALSRAADDTLTAQWSKVYSITAEPMGEVAVWTLVPETAGAGSMITLLFEVTSTAWESGYRFEKMTITDENGQVTEISTDPSGTPYTEVNPIPYGPDGNMLFVVSFVMPASDITLAAVFLEPGPTGYHINVTDYTKGAAVTSLDAEALYSGEVSFTVACDKVCKVGVLNADGTITKLSCTTEDEVHSFTVTVTDADVNLVIVVKGDVNLDGNLKGSDSTFIKKLMVELVELDEEKAAIQSFAGDVNDDGKLKQNDATMISRIMVELETLTW